MKTGIQVCTGGRMRKRKVLLSAFTFVSALTSSVMIPAAEPPAQTVQAEEKADYYIFPDSDSRFLSEADIWRLSREDFRLAKNEIYARHGRRFNSPELQAYFDEMAWYEGSIAPEQFDPSCFNAFETANVSFLDRQWQNETGEGKESIVEREAALARELLSFETAETEDLIGLDSFAESVTVFYRQQEAQETQQDKQFTVLGSFYTKDGSFYGNIGFRKDIGYMNEGDPCAWFDGHFYKEIVESCGQMTVSSPHQYGPSHWDSYGLYEDGSRIAWYMEPVTHNSGGRGWVSWLITQDAVYAGGNEGLKVFDRFGKLVEELDGYSCAFASYDGNVYLISESGALVMAEDAMLEHTTILDMTDGWINPACTGESSFVYSYQENLYCFDMESRTARIIDESDGWDSWAVSGNFIYGVDGNADRNRTVIHRLSLEDGSRENVCVIDGVLYGWLEKAEGNLLYLSVGPKDSDWTSDEGNINSVQIAVDLETGTVFILQAGWHS